MRLPPTHKTQGAWEGSSPVNRPPLRFGGIGRGILGGDADGTDTLSDILGGATAILNLVSTGNPLELAGGKVRAGGESRHESVSVGLREFYRVGGSGVNP